MTEVMFAIDGGLRDLLREAPNTVGIPEVRVTGPVKGSCGTDKQ